MRNHGLFLSTLRVAGGSAFKGATFFPAALTAAALVFADAAAAARVGFFTTVVPVEVPDALLLLLTIRLSGSLDILALPRFALVTGALTGGAGFEAFRLVPAAGRPGLSLSLTRLARVVVAATAAALAGDGGFVANAGFNGEAGRARYDFCGDASIGLIGERGRVRELDDFGESTLEGFVTCRLGSTVVVLIRFLGLGICWFGSGVFSLSAPVISSLSLDQYLTIQAQDSIDTPDSLHTSWLRSIY